MFRAEFILIDLYITHANVNIPLKSQDTGTATFNFGSLLKFTIFLWVNFKAVQAIIVLIF